uniref:IgGFc-binding protein N-terminal domain-containing protein n=1 Tax=Latimeria chalumnae TaxID=7897 RepID=H3A0X0_LATCH
CPVGTEFITAFMENADVSSQSGISLTTTIFAFEPSTLVTVTVHESSFRKEYILNEMEAQTVNFNSDAELGPGTSRSNKTVIIRANSSVVVLSMNYKTRTADTAVIYPVEDLSTEYYVLTPGRQNGNYHNEFAVINSNQVNIVTVSLKASVTYEGKSYPSGSNLTLYLSKYENIQIQSTEDLSGSHVVSQYPVAVLSGHQCVKSSSISCDHVFEQLLPVSKWGTSFIVVPLLISNNDDFVFVVAYQKTAIQIKSGSSQEIKELNGGEKAELILKPSVPLTINATTGIMVMFFCTGNSYKSIKYDPALINIIPTDTFYNSYISVQHSSFRNHIVLIVITTQISGLKLDNKHPFSSNNWMAIQGTEYSWTDFQTTFGNGYTVLNHSSSSFGVYSYGSEDFGTYGSTGICFD